MLIYHPIHQCRKPLCYLIVQITSLNTDARGKTLSIEAKGSFSAEVREGAYMNLSVKYGLIRLIHQTSDLCEILKNVDEKCPLDGEKVIRKEIKLPSTIPPVCEGHNLFSLVLI